MLNGAASLLCNNPMPSRVINGPYILLGNLLLLCGWYLPSLCCENMDSRPLKSQMKILLGRARLRHNVLCLPSLFWLRALTFPRKIESGLDRVSPYRYWERRTLRDAPTTPVHGEGDIWQR
jgi:hypothetical protein